MRGRSIRAGIGFHPWWRQLRHDSAIVWTIGIATFVTSVFVTLAPRVLEHASAEDLQSAVASATPEQRNLRFEQTSRYGDGPVNQPFFFVERKGRVLFEQELPDSVQEIVGGQLYVVDSPDFVVSSFPQEEEGPFPTTFRFRYQNEIEDHFELVEGEMPGTPDPLFRFGGSECPENVAASPDVVLDPDLDCALIEIAIIDTVVSAQTAEDMMVAVGDSVTLSPSLTDLRWRASHGDVLAIRIILRISGIVELSDPNLEYWYADSSLHRARITENPDFRLVDAVGLIRPDRYRTLLRSIPEVGFDYTWRYLVDPSQVRDNDAEQLALDIGKIGPEDLRTVTLLPEVLRSHIAQRRSSIQLLSTVVAGTMVVSLATILILSALGAMRRRAAQTLVIDRGASRLQVASNAARTAVLVALPAAAFGWIASWAALPETSSKGPVQLVAAVAIGVAFAQLLASVSRRRTDAPTDHPRGDGGRRIMVEVALVAIAGGAVWVLTRRGAISERSDPESVDALLSVAPGLVAIAAAVIAIRLLSPIMSAAGAISTRGSGIGLFVGFRRVVDKPSLRLPIAMLVVASAVAVFASILLSSISSLQQEESWQTVGADYRVQTLEPDLKLPARFSSALARTEFTSVAGTVLENQRFSGPGRAEVLDVVAIDLTDYQAAVRSPNLPSRSIGTLLATSNPEPAKPTDPVSAIIVGLSVDPDSWPIGTTGNVRIGGFSPRILIAGSESVFPGIDPSRLTLVVDLPELARSTNERTSQPEFVLISGAESDITGVGSLITENDVSARLTSRYERLDEVAGDPLSRWIRLSLQLGAVFCFVFAVAGSVSVAAITEPARRSDLSLLRVVGLSSREARTITTVEQGPIVLMSVLVGALTGIFIAVLFAESLRLPEFAGVSGSNETVGLSLDPFVISVLAGVLAIVVALTITISMRLAQRAPAAQVLRIGDLYE